MHLSNDYDCFCLSRVTNIHPSTTLTLTHSYTSCHGFPRASTVSARKTSEATQCEGRSGHPGAYHYRHYDFYYSFIDKTFHDEVETKVVLPGNGRHNYFLRGHAAQV